MVVLFQQQDNYQPIITQIYAYGFTLICIVIIAFLLAIAPYAAHLLRIGDYPLNGVFNLVCGGL